MKTQITCIRKIRKYMKQCSCDPVILCSRAWMMILFVVISTLHGSTQSLEADIDKIFSWVTPGSPGCVCAVSQDGKTLFNKAYGLADLERNTQLTTESIFDAGSVTKQFVAAAMLILVEDGKVSLSDDIRKYIPELHDYGHVVTIDHLLTHTSGIRDWTGLIQFEDGDSDALTLAYRQRELNFIPGEAFSYSNSGYAIAKEIIARVTKMPFGEFAQQRLFDPLGMKSTTYRHDMRDVIPARALAYEKEKDQWKLAMLTDKERGGGGALFSTPSDLLIWNDALTHGKLGTYVTEKLQEPAKLTNGRKLDYARGLFLEDSRAGRLVWHSGSASGYKTLLSRFLDHDISIAIMCNAGDVSTKSSPGMRIVNSLVAEGEFKAEAEKGPPPAFTAGIDTTGFNISSRQGLYFNDITGESLQFVMQDGRLRIAQGPALVAMSKDHFKRWGAKLEFMSQDAFEIQFVSADAFDYKSMEGKVTRYRRAVPFTPSASELSAYAGSYESDELKCIFQIAPTPGGLKLWIDHTPGNPLEFKPVDRDTFQWGRMTLKFVRDRNGKVEALEYVNPVFTGVRFEKLEIGN